MAVQEFGELDGRLAAEGHHDAYRLLHLDDVHHILREQRLEVQAVGGIVVSGNRFRVVVDNDHLIAQLLQRPDAVDGGVVKLDALPDADGAGAQHHNDRLAAAGEGAGFAEPVERGVEIGGLRVKLRAAGVHHLIDGGLAVTGQGFRAGQPLEGLVRIAQLLAGLIMLRGEAVRFQRLLKVRHLLQLGKEPAVNAGDAENLVDGGAGFQGFKNGEQPVVVHPAEPLPDGGVILRVLFAVQAVQPHFRAPDGLHQRHFKAGCNGHDLAGGLHLGSQLPAGIGKLVKGPLGHFHHDVVQRRLKAGAGLAGNVVFDLVQRVAQRDLRGDLGDGITGGLGGQRRRTGHAGVHLDNGVLKAVGIQRQLHVAAAHDAQMGDDVQRRLAEHLELLVRQRLGGGYHDGVAGMDAHRVKVFHGADGDDVAHAVPHGLKLDLLPAEDGPLHQNLRDGRGIQTGLGDDPQLRLIGCRAAAGAAQRKGRADDHRVADAVGHRQRVLHRFGNVRGNHRLADLRHGFLEKFPVLGTGNGFRIRSQQTDALLGKKSLLIQLHGQRQAGLAAQPCQNGVGLLLFDDPLDGFRGQRLQIDLVRHGLIGHDGGGVGVAQHHVHAGFLQNAAGLRAGIVELGGLSDDNGAGADDENFFDPFIQRHYSSPPFIKSTNRSKRKDVSLGPVQASGWNWTVNAFSSG